MLNSKNTAQFYFKINYFANVYMKNISENEILNKITKPQIIPNINNVIIITNIIYQIYQIYIGKYLKSICIVLKYYI